MRARPDINGAANSILCQAPTHNSKDRPVRGQSSRASAALPRDRTGSRASRNGRRWGTEGIGPDRCRSWREPSCWALGRPRPMAMRQEIGSGSVDSAPRPPTSILTDPPSHWSLAYASLIAWLEPSADEPPAAYADAPAVMEPVRHRVDGIAGRIAAAEKGQRAQAARATRRRPISSRRWQSCGVTSARRNPTPPSQPAGPSPR